MVGLLLLLLLVQGVWGRRPPAEVAAELLSEYEAGNVPREVVQQAATALRFGSVEAMIEALRSKTAASYPDLVDAAVRVDLQAVRKLLKGNIDLHSPPPGEPSPLLAVLLRWEEGMHTLAGESMRRRAGAVLHALLAAGAQADSRCDSCVDSKGRSPLMVAAASRDAVALNVLAVHANLTAEDAVLTSPALIGATALHLLADTMGWLMRLCTIYLARARDPPSGVLTDDGRTCSRAAMQVLLEKQSTEAMAAVLTRTLRGGIYVKDEQGRTPLAVAALHGDAAAVSALLSVGAVEDEVVVRLASSGCHGGLAGQLQGEMSQCPTRVLEADSSAAAEELDAAFKNRVPLLVRGGGKDWAASGSIESLLRNAGHVKVPVAGVPYATRYGGDSEEMTLSDFASSALQLAAPCPQPYAVVGGGIARDLADAAGCGQPPVLVPVAKSRPPQVMLGPAGSGSPAHFHQDALNFVVEGRKQWLMWPPSRAYLSKVPAEELFADDNHGALRVEQAAGDIVYVPEGWGHATLNVETTLAVTFEFYR